MSNRSKLKQQIRRARRQGMSPLELLQTKQIARLEAERVCGVSSEVDNETADKAFLCMVAIPVSILATNYWPKSAKERVPKFVDEVLTLYESVQSGEVSAQSLADTLQNLANVNIEASWLDRKQDTKK